MDAKTAITLQQKARKNARNGIAGMNVNDMRYSCQGYMGGGSCEKSSDCPTVGGCKGSCALICGPDGCANECTYDATCGMFSARPGGTQPSRRPSRAVVRRQKKRRKKRRKKRIALAGGVFPYDEDGPCQFTHCHPECHPGQVPGGPGPGGHVPGGEYTGGVFPCDPDGPCGFTHCIEGGPCPTPLPDCGVDPCDHNHGGGIPGGEYAGRHHRGHGDYCVECGVELEGYSGGPFPPTCDQCAPCGLYNQSTCTPCEGPQRNHRWGNQWTPDDFGGRMCARPCPPDPCFPPSVPPKKVPPNGATPKIPVPRPKTPPSKIPTPKTPPPRTPCPPGWVRPKGSRICVPTKFKIPTPPPCPPDTVCCFVLDGDRLFLQCEDVNHPWNGMDVTEYGKCFGANGDSVCAIRWSDECGDHILEGPICRPGEEGYYLSPVPVPQPPPGRPKITKFRKPQPIPPPRPKITKFALPEPIVPPYTPEPMSVTPKMSKLAFAGRVRSPSAGVGRR